MQGDIQPHVDPTNSVDGKKKNKAHFSLGLWGSCCLPPAVTVQRRELHPGLVTSALKGYKETNNEKFSHSHPQLGTIYLTSMFLVQGRKPEHLEKTHMCTGGRRTCKLFIKRQRGEPASFLLGGDSFNNCTTVMSHIKPVKSVIS